MWSFHSNETEVVFKITFDIELTLVPGPLVLEPRGLGQHQRLRRPELGRRRQRGAHPLAQHHQFRISRHYRRDHHRPRGEEVPGEEGERRLHLCAVLSRVFALTSLKRSGGCCYATEKFIGIFGSYPKYPEIWIGYDIFLIVTLKTPRCDTLET